MLIEVILTFNISVNIRGFLSNRKSLNLSFYGTHSINREAFFKTHVINGSNQQLY